MNKTISERAHVQIPLAEHLTRQGSVARLEVEASGLFVDIVTDDQIIECKTFLTLRNMQTAVGQLALYGLDYPLHKKAIAVWAVKDEKVASRLSALGIGLYIVSELLTCEAETSSHWGDDMLTRILLDETAKHLAKTPVGSTLPSQQACRLLLEPYLASAQILFLVRSFLPEQAQIEYSLLVKAGKLAIDKSSAIWEHRACDIPVESLKNNISKLFVQTIEYETCMARNSLELANCDPARVLRAWLDTALSKGIDKNWARTIRPLLTSSLARILVSCSSDPFYTKLFGKDLEAAN